MQHHATPILYQHLTDLIQRKLIQDHFAITATQESPGSSSAVTDNETNALQYAAGYIIRSITKKIPKIRATSTFKDLVNCCHKLVKQRYESATAEDWTNLVDWGGLWHVKETTFQLICSLEEEIRKHLHTLTSTGTPGLREIVHTLISSDDVHFYWCIATAEEVHDHLLKMIVQLFVTVRGFAYASWWIERYKQTAKKSTQRSKSLRTLHTAHDICHTSYYVTLPTLYDICYLW